MSYRFITDPGHGWLEVPLSELVDLGIAQDISKCSYLSANGIAYLEEDCDAPRFNDAKGEFDIDTVHQEQTFVRTLPHYQCPDYVDPDPPKPYRSGGETWAGKEPLDAEQREALRLQVEKATAKNSPAAEAYFDRFDIVTAYYLFFAHYHQGLGSVMYARGSKILTYFKPDLGVQNNMMNENTQAIYNKLVEREKGGTSG